MQRDSDKQLDPESINASLERQGVVSERLKTAFHETFALSRPALTQIMAVAQASDLREMPTTSEDRRALLRKETSLGTNYIKAMPRYGWGAGLLDTKVQLTPFGAMAHSRDPLLESLATQWLMHYHLSAPHGPGPAFWHNLVVTRFFPGDEFETDDIENEIAAFVERTEGKSLSRNSVRPTATAFLGTYSKPDGLGKLGILEQVGIRRYRVADVDPPPVWAFGAALVDYWRARFSDYLTLDLEQISSPGKLGAIFLLSPGRVNMLLSEMQTDGYVELHRLAPPYQVVLLKPNPEIMLRRMYDIG